MSDKTVKKNTVHLKRLQNLINTKTREEIANALNCDTSLITKHYNGNREVTVDYLVKYAQYFGVSADYLLDISDCKKTTNTEEGKTIRIICDYIGLCEEAIKKLHSYVEANEYTAGVPDEFFDFFSFFIMEASAPISIYLKNLKDVLTEQKNKSIDITDDFFEDFENSIKSGESVTDFHINAISQLQQEVISIEKEIVYVEKGLVDYIEHVVDKYLEFEKEELSKKVGNIKSIMEAAYSCLNDTDLN